MAENTITITILRSDAELLVTRTRQIALANQAVAEKYSAMTAAFVDEAARKSEIFGRISAALDSSLEDPKALMCNPECSECQFIANGDSSGFCPGWKGNSMSLRKQA